MRQKISMSLRLTVVAFFAVFATNIVPVVSAYAATPNTEDQNHTTYWENLGYGTCTKLENPGGTSYTLGTPPAGKYWTLLVVKASTDKEVTENPQVGVAYNAPLNDKGKPRDVSHVIYCSKKIPLTPVTAGVVTYVDLCGKANDTFTVPTTAHVTYSVASGTHAGVGTVTVTASADANYELTSPYTFSHAFTDVACPVEIDPCLTVISREEDSFFVARTVHENPKCKVTICHATNSAHNPYRQIIVSTKAVDGQGKNDHSHHDGPVFDTLIHNQQNRGWGDIIPPVEGVTDGLNWTEQGRAIYNKDCKAPTVKHVTPADPTQTTPTCEKLGSYTIPTTRGVQYKVNGTNVSAGIVNNVPNGTTVTITAEALPGRTLTGDSSWTFTFTAPTNCVPGDSDACPNIAGSQVTVPSGMMKNQAGDCVTFGGSGGQVLGAATVVSSPAVLANTGEDSNPLINIVVGIAIFGMALGSAVLVRKQEM